MANTLKFKRGLVSGIPTAALGEPLFTTDTFDLYIGNGTGNTRFQKYIASGATTQILRGDGSLYSFPLNISSATTNQVLRFDGTNWVNSNENSGTGTVTSVAMSVPTGLSVSGSPITTNGTLNVTFASGYSIPTNAKQTEWDTAYTNRITSLTTIGSSGASTLTSNILNIPNYTLSGLGGVPSSRTLTINGTGYDLSIDRSWSVGTITSLTGEASASGTGAVSVILDNASVIGKVLTGLNLTGGGTIASTDTILQAFGKVQNQISAMVGGVTYQGTWNASTNSPSLTSSVGTKGYYYVVATAGSTNLNGITDWKIGDWVIFNGSTWDKVDNTDAVSSVNGYTGAVSLSTSDIGEGTNLYFTNTRAQNAITLTTSGSSGASTYTGGTLNIPTYSLSGLGGVPTSRTLTINGTAFDLSTNRSWSVGTVTSVAMTVPTGLSISGTPITSNGTLALSLQSGYSIPTTSSQTNWDAAYNDKINSAAFSGTTTKTLTLTQQDAGTVTASFTDIGFDNPMTTLGDVIYGAASGVATRLAGNTTTTKQFLSQTGTGTVSAAPAWATITGADITGAALTKTDDTNVTLTLGGTPSTALLRAASITVGWTGQLAVSRGGTGLSALGTAGQLLRVNTGATALEYFTPTYITGNQTITISGDASGSGTTAITLTLATVNSNVGTFNNVTVNAKGLVTAASNVSYLTGNQSITWTASGDVSGSASGATSISPSLTVTGLRGVALPTLTAGGGLLKYTGTGTNTWVFDTATYLTAAITSLNGLTAASQTFANDTNVTITSATSTHTIGWSGQLAVGRGGTGASTLTGVLLGNGTSAFTAITGTASQYLRRNSGNTAYEFGAIAGADVTGAALTKTDDTNVTLTLGGTPTTALLRAASLTLGWTGQLAVGRGGSGASTLTGVLIGNGTSAFTGVTGTANQLLRRNAGDTAYEFFTPSYLTANQTITLSGDVSGSGSTAITTTIGSAAVTYAKIQNVAANTFLANATGSAATVQEIATSRIPLFASAITGTPSASTYLRGDGSWATVSGGSGTPAGSTGEVQFNNAGAFGADSNFYWDNTNKRLGIGNASPIAGLHLQINSNFTGGANYTAPHLYIRSGTAATNGNVTRLAFGVFDGAQVYLDAICTETGGGKADFAIYTRNTSAPAERVRITSGGNVLIGTTTDSGEKLQVSGTMKVTGASTFDVTDAGVGTKTIVATFGRSGATASGTARELGIVFSDSANTTLVGGISGVRDNSAGNFLGGLKFYVNASSATPSTTFANLTPALSIGSNSAAIFSSSVTAGGNFLIPAGSGLAWSGDATRIITPEDNVSGALIQTPGIIRFNSGGTSVRMTLTANGRLLLGTTTEGSELLQVSGTMKVTGAATFSSSVTAGGNIALGNTSSSSPALITFQNNANGFQFGFNSTTTQRFVWNNGAPNEIMSLTGTGNLGLGVTPSAWFSNRRVMQVGGGVSLAGVSGSAGLELRNNAYLNTSGSETYLNTDFATLYASFNGEHRFYNAPSGTAGNAISFTQAMTLKSTGQLQLNLYQATTSFTGTAVGVLAFDASGNIITIATPGGSGSPGGSNTQVQFNNSGSFAGDSNFTWDNTNKVLSVKNLTINTSGQNLEFSSFYGSGSNGSNIFIGGGGKSSISSGTAQNGSDNTSLGFSALQNNTTGFTNIAIGNLSMITNTSGYGNIGLGVSSLYANTSGIHNTAVGISALGQNTSGNYNTALGYNAGYYTNAAGVNSTTTNSIYIGYDTRSSASGNSNEIVIGYNGRGNGSNTITLGNTSTVDTYVLGSLRASTGIKDTRIDPRSITTASTATLTPDVSADDFFTVTAQTATITLANPTGTPVEGQKILIRIKDNGTARSIQYGTQYRASTDYALPTTTTVSKTIYLGFIYNSTDTKWDLLAKLDGF